MCKMTKINGHFLAHLYIYGRSDMINQGNRLQPGTAGGILGCRSCDLPNMRKKARRIRLSRAIFEWLVAMWEFEERSSALVYQSQGSKQQKKKKDRDGF